MVQWLLKQRLSVKLILPSVAGVALLLLAGILVFTLVQQQRKLGTAYDDANFAMHEASTLVTHYSQTQTKVYKGLSFALAGLGAERAGISLKEAMSSKEGLESAIKTLSTKATLMEIRQSLDSALVQSGKYFNYVQQIQDNIDDPASAASNMITTEKKYEALRASLTTVSSLQEAEMKKASALT